MLKAFQASSDDVVASEATSSISRWWRRFAHAPPEPARNLTERAEDIFLPSRLRLLVGENVAGGAVLGAQPDDAECRGLRSIHQRPRRSPSARTRHEQVGSVAHPPLLHQRQRSPDALLRDQAEERRLLELDRESLSQRLVEHGIAGRIGEIAEHDRVLVGELRRCG